MEGLASNFEEVFQHFATYLKAAHYVSIDMELSGVEIDDAPDGYEESVEARVAKLCEIAEKYTPIQLGITLVGNINGKYWCSSYIFYMLPWQGPELLGHNPSWGCHDSAIEFLSQQGHIDFSKWTRDSAIPYMTREDEERYLASLPSEEDKEVLPQKTGLLRLWKLLCEARLPVVTHGPKDIFFLMSCFERQKLPRCPQDISALILSCLPIWTDTSQLFGSIGNFTSLNLVTFLRDVQSRHSHLLRAGRAPSCEFLLVGHTAGRYAEGSNLAHEAGFDSLCTAKLYAFLCKLYPIKVTQNMNNLFLYKSIRYLDLNHAAKGESPAASFYDLSRDELWVGRLRNPADQTSLKLVSGAGFVYKRMNHSDILVSLDRKAPGGPSGEAATLRAVPNMQWLVFDDWCAEASAIKGQRHAALDVTLVTPRHFQHHKAPADDSDFGTPSTRCDTSDDEDAEKWIAFESYHGVIKTPEDRDGFHLIESIIAWARFKQDVSVHYTQLQHLPQPVSVGQAVRFEVATNAWGCAMARHVTLCNNISAWLDEEVATKETDDTTTESWANSDCASTTDLDPVQDSIIYQ